MKEEELNDLKYRELQKLAKENGVKANLPKSALIEALLEAFGENKDSTEVEAEESNNQSDLTSQKEILNIPTDSTDPECEMKKDAPNSRRNSRKKDLDPVSTNSKDKSTGKKSFDQ